jgi:hypothetical protein
MSMTGVLTGVVGVNAAFLRDIKEDNRELRLLMRRAERLSAAPDKVFLGPAAARELIEALRDQVALHFTLEEAFGYFDQTWGTPPEFASWAERLRAQHLPLYQQICDLAIRAEKRLIEPPDGNFEEPAVNAIHALLDSLAAFLRRLHSHESAENQLILDALELDIGVGD